MFNVRMNKFGNKASGSFAMTFANGYTVSVAMGDGIYSNGIPAYSSFEEYLEGRVAYKRKIA
jgi:hypothetical protein